VQKREWFEYENGFFRSLRWTIHSGVLIMEACINIPITHFNNPCRVLKMVRAPCCEKMGLKKGPWTQDEDQILISYIQKHGHANWRALPKLAGTSFTSFFIDN